VVVAVGEEVQGHQVVVVEAVEMLELQDQDWRLRPASGNNGQNLYRVWLAMKPSSLSVPAPAMVTCSQKC
jgi:hypothetical protein